MSGSTRGRLVVIGGDAAGMSAASVARRLAPDLEITVLEQGAHISYAACGLPYLIGGEVGRAADLLVLTPEQAREQRGLDVRVGHRAVAIDPAARVVECEKASPAERIRLEYDRLVVATGARPVVPPLPGVNLPGVFAVRQLQHGLDLQAFLASRRPARAVIAGAGFVGLEMTEALRARGLQVTVLKHGSAPLLDLEPALGETLEEALARHGCVLLREAPLYGLERAGREALTVKAGGESLPADLILLAMGVRPAVGLAERAGLVLGPGGAIQVGERQETSMGGIFAAGDCATQVHRVTGLPVYQPQALAANRQGRVAGANAAAQLKGATALARHHGTVGTHVMQVFDTDVGLAGLTLPAARAAGLDAGATVVRSTSRAKYYPGSAPLKVALVAERPTGRLLGGQLVGPPGTAKRIDVVATALMAGMDLEGLAGLDLGYAPPFGPVWDAWLIAARQALKGAS